MMIASVQPSGFEASNSSARRRLGWGPRLHRRRGVGRGWQRDQLAHGITVALLVELVRAGLATASTERVVASGTQLEVVRVRITEAGRRALADAGR